MVKVQPATADPALNQGFITDAGTYAYMLNFENDTTTTAQTVTLTEQLDPSLDWSTFQLGDIGFGGLSVSVPAGRTSFSTRFDATDTLGVYVDVSANLNLTTGAVTWTFTALDPKTLDLPSDPTLGVLSPTGNSLQGQGFVTYTVKPNANLAQGTHITAQAAIVLNTNTTIQTQALFNSIDTVPPTSSVNPLPAIVNSPRFTVSWSDSDPNGPVGVTYDIFTSDNGGPFAPWLTNTPQTSATYNGQVGHHYSFYSVATDPLGLTQPTPTAAQAMTYVWVSPSPPPAPPPSSPSPTAQPAPPTLQTPSLLAFFDQILGAVETVNGNGTETVIDSLFGFPLFVSTYDSAGALTSVTLFGIDVTFVFE